MTFHRPVRYLAAMNNEPMTEDAIIGKATIAGINP